MINNDWCHCSLSGVMLLACHVAAGDMAPGGVNKEAGRGGATPAYLCWAQPHHHLHHCCVVAGAWWWWWMGCVIDGGGGWVVSSMVVVGRKKQCGNVWATAAAFGLTGAEGRIFCFCFTYNIAIMAQLALAFVLLVWLRVQFHDSVNFFYLK